MYKIFVLCLILFVIPLFADNPFNRALALNGDGQFLEVPDSTCEDLANADILTVEIRFKQMEERGYTLLNKWKYFQPESESYGYGRFMGHGWLVDINKTSEKIEGKLEYRYLDPLDGFFSNRVISLTRAAVRDDGGWGYSTSRSVLGRLSNDEWHHLACVIVNRNQQVFFDGVSLGGGGSSSDRSIVIPGHPLNVGGFIDSVDATLDLTAYFKGEIDELRIWNKVLTADDINARMNDTLSADIYTSVESGLIGYYRFEKLENLGIGNDGLANDVRDLSVYANHGNVWNGGTLTEKAVQTAVADQYEIPVTYQLYQNFPNPFNPSTRINFDLPHAGPVEIVVYDIRGRIVASLADNMMEAGSHSINWASPTLPSGIYICRMTSNSFNKTIKMVLQK